MRKKFDLTDKNSAIFIMPRSSKAWVGAEAVWITVAGWSASAKRRFKNVWVITSDRIAQPEEVIHYPLVNKSAYAVKKPILFKWIPVFIKIFVKDVLLWRQSKKWSIIHQKPWTNEQVAFIWEQHDLFPGPGRKLASELNIPLVTYVHAPVVWEAAKWGVNRYFWGWFLEKFVEARSLGQSDVVACVSNEVAEKLAKMGVDKNKILVSPMAVDPYLFGAYNGNIELRKRLGLENKIVIGWTGSFRSFHGLDLVVKAFDKVHHMVPESRLLLVGDGFERDSMENLVKELTLTDSVIFAGRQSFAKIPAYVSIFDIALVSARSAAGFHYSPLKLREYLAGGKPVLAPRAGEIPQMFTDNFHLKLYEAGDVEELISKLSELINNPEMAQSLAAQGKRYALESSTWDHELDKLVSQIG